jgi:kumamolisin
MEDTMPSRKLFHDSIVELPSEAGVTASGLNIHAAEEHHHDELMTVSFSLSPAPGLNEELEARATRGEVVPIQEIRTRYGVTQGQLEPLLDWLRTQHFDIVSVSSDKTSVYARATASSVARALQVDLVRVTAGGVTYTSVRNAPSLPEDVAANVRAIGGLQPHRQAHKHSKRFTRGNRPATAADDVAETNADTQNGYLISQILSAYGADGLDVTGDGQTIAIVIDTAPKPSDMAAFWERNGQSNDPNRIAIVNVNSVQLPPPTGEETLDAQWTSGIAPGAKVRIYATGSLVFSDIDNALDRILDDVASDPGLRQVSMSLGLGESYMAPGELKTEHAKFVRLAAAGVNVFVSSGDAGSNPDSTGHGSGGPLQAEYESSDPCVIGVGGTTLQLALDGAVGGETGWPNGGGGKSRYFKRPGWQKVKGILGGTTRLVPDVSLTADPNFGGLVVLHGDEVQFGGTSWSALSRPGFRGGYLV